MAKHGSAATGAVEKEKEGWQWKLEVSALMPEGNWLLPNRWQLTFWAMVECRKAKHTNQPLNQMYIHLVFLKKHLPV